MNPSEVVLLGRQMLWIALVLAGPALAASLVVGLLISVLQTLTSIQEQTLNFVPRLVCVALVLAVTMPWLLRVAVHYTIRMLANLPEVLR